MRSLSASKHLAGFRLLLFGNRLDSLGLQLVNRAIAFDLAVLLVFRASLRSARTSLVDLRGEFGVQERQPRIHASSCCTSFCNSRMAFVILLQQSWPKSIASRTCCFGNLRSARFHHHDSVVSRANHDVEFGLASFFVGRIGEQLVHRPDRRERAENVMEGDVGNCQRSGSADNRQRPRDHDSDRPTSPSRSPGSHASSLRGTADGSDGQSSGW